MTDIITIQTPWVDLKYNKHRDNFDSIEPDYYISYWRGQLKIYAVTMVWDNEDESLYEHEELLAEYYLQPLLDTLDKHLITPEELENAKIK